MTDDDLKKCAKCGEVKPFDGFNKCRSSKDGLQPQCKECAKRYRETHKKTTPEHKRKVAEYKKRYKQTHKTEVAESKKRYAKKRSAIQKAERAACNVLDYEANKEHYADCINRYYREHKK